MVFTPDAIYQADDWDYILGEIHDYGSIAVDRHQYLMRMSCMSDYTMQLALKDPVTGTWSKWKSYYEWKHSELFLAYDIHRSILKNEIVVESDYPTYDENVGAARLIGEILELKGFKPKYYYSGNKSIHIHVWFDWNCLLTLDMPMQELILDKFTKAMFFKKFMDFLREKIVSCWGVNARQFDEQLVKADRHLIRSELSMNKLGFKTFVGDSYTKLSIIPHLCAKDTGFYPAIGTVELSSPTDIKELIDEFLSTLENKKAKNKTKRKEYNLNAFLNPEDTSDLKPCVYAMLDESFATSGDGFNRAMFILANELKRHRGEVYAASALQQWNERMGSPIRPVELDYHLRRTQDYKLGCDYIYGFLKTLGLTKQCEKCKHKLFKE